MLLDCSGCKKFGGRSFGQFIATLNEENMTEENGYVHVEP